MSRVHASESQNVEQKPELPALDDLVPLAAVIGAGCEPCAERMVARALERKNAQPSVERTLAILAQLAGAACFAEAVGPEHVDRVKRSLRAGRNALDGPATRRTTCCG